MASAAWTPATNAPASTWSKNQTLSDLQTTAPLYNDPTITFNSSTIFYNGYDSSTTTPEGVPGTTWSSVTTGNAATWAKVAE